jgi:hypothetical protein
MGLLVDEAQKAHRFVCQLSAGDLIHSPELANRSAATPINRSIVFSGDIQWVGGFRPETIQEKNESGFGSTTTSCPNHHHPVESGESLQTRKDQLEYDSVDCNV